MTPTITPKGDGWKQLSTQPLGFARPWGGEHMYTPSNPREICIHNQTAPEVLANLSARLDEWFGMREIRDEGGFVVFGRRAR